MSFSKPLSLAWKPYGTVPCCWFIQSSLHFSASLMQFRLTLWTLSEQSQVNDARKLDDGMTRIHKESHLEIRRGLVSVFMFFIYSLENNMAGSKITMFNRKYIFIHGCSFHCHVGFRECIFFTSNNESIGELVGGFNRIEKYERQNGKHAQVRGDNTKNIWVATT